MAQTNSSSSTLLPRFQIRFLILLITVFGFLSIAFRMAWLGHAWAIAFSITLAFAAFAAIVFVLVFLVTFIIAFVLDAIRSKPRLGSPFGKNGE